MERQKSYKLRYRFHDPNPPGVVADFLVKVFTEVNMPKAEAAIHAIPDMRIVNEKAPDAYAKSASAPPGSSDICT